MRNNDPNDLPIAEESLHRLRLAGWNMGEAGFTGSGGRYVHQVDGTCGERSIRVTAPTA